MHRDEIKGAAKDAKGTVKEAAGKATGNERLEAEGVADQAAGKVQKGVGNLKDAARDALKH
ncbi:CsbD family protein [Phenylobacterium sp. J367]|uniref:CsbD family protein n=1 Tax=Phenylobacterium sp. J367 TaxID=2898435 RepID=UPI002150A4EA|nr:CsbD family protein [Phenylobacterium sp. J367]MCR5878888.1 CsbD family protein [Phenylobacterium sp. J367]